jgi:hypothetical protein
VDVEFVWMGVRALVLGAAFVGFAWALLRMRREHAEQLDRVHEGQRALTAQIHTLSERTSALATLVASLPRPAERGAGAPPPPHQRREVSSVRSYETARRLARSGASVEEIVATAGLAASEARLLRRLQGAEAQRGSVA